MDQQQENESTSRLSRGKFIKLSGLTLSGLMIGLKSLPIDHISVRGFVYDLLGFPVQGAQLSLVTGYSFFADDGLNISKSLSSPVSSGPLGAFSLNLSNPKTDVAFRVNYQDELLQINTNQVTGTYIPFYNAEVWSVDSNKKVNNLATNGSLGNVTTYIDPSRKYIWNYFSSQHPQLIFKLKNDNQIDEPKEPWEGNHLNPDVPGECDNCDDHYYDPDMASEKKINIPWGSKRGVLPFIPAEGVVYWVNDEANNKSLDGDWEWEIILEPQYQYLPNRDNQNLDGPPDAPRNKELQFHTEMCRWFMGRSTNNNLQEYTNVRRDQSLKQLNDAFNGQRVWVIGSWTVDDGHHNILGESTDNHNEFHPVYWIVRFIGGWRRFCAAETLRINSSTGARTIINNQLTSSPEIMLEQLNANLEITMALKQNSGHQAVVSFYAESITYLNKFGLNFSFPYNNNNSDNSIDPQDFLSAGNLSFSQLANNIKFRYALIYKHLTTLGSGVFVFPTMIFIYESTDIIQQADKMKLLRPANFDMTGSTPSHIQITLGKQALSLRDTIVDRGVSILKLAYLDLFTQMRSSIVKSGSVVTDALIAGYYATVSIRLINYGVFEDNDPSHSPHYADHYNWALKMIKTEINALTNSINVRLDAVWKDAFPFTRTI